MASSNTKTFPTLGQRVLAALVSYQMGHVGVDRILKENYVDSPTSPLWEDKCLEMLRELVNATSLSVLSDDAAKDINTELDSASSQYDTKAEIIKLIELFLTDASTGALTHAAQSYTGSKTGAPGLVIYMASCPDNIAKQFHAELDESGKRFLAEHGIHPIRKQ
jgi:hypothetical protein